MALSLQTADCMPIFIFNQNTTIALHAGWRGIENSIILEALQQLKVDKSFLVYIGPHIQFQSFEVELDVAERLKDTFNKVQAFNMDQDPLVRPYVFNKDKVFVNLKKIARSQLVAGGIHPAKIFSSPIDTFADNNFHSYRRDGDKAGRNISFCFLC